MMKRPPIYLVERHLLARRAQRNWFRPLEFVAWLLFLPALLLATWGLGVLVYVFFYL